MPPKSQTPDVRHVKPTPPPPAKVRNRSPERDAFLDRLEEDGPDEMERVRLRANGYAADVDHYEQSGAALSHGAIAFLLMDELGYRRYVAGPSWEDLDASSRRHRIGTALIPELRRAPAPWELDTVVDAFKVLRHNRDRLSAGQRSFLARVEGKAQDAYESRDRLQLWRSGRLRDHGPLGERAAAIERYESLRKELGEGFVTGTDAHRAKKVREWQATRRRKSRDASLRSFQTAEGGSAPAAAA